MNDLALRVLRTILSTCFESTVYTSSITPKNLEALLRLESDRFKYLQVSKDMLDLEHKAVWSEYSTKFDADPVFDRWYGVYAAAD